MRGVVLVAAVGASLVALGAACGKGSPGTSPAGDADAGGDDGGAEGSYPEVPRSPSKLALADIVGLSSHPMLGSNPASSAERAFEWSALADLGMHRMRTDFTWASIEPQRGTFVFTDYDALVSEAKAHGVSLLAVLDYGVPWATSAAGTDDHYPPDNPADFGAFAAAVASRYAPGLVEYEAWNEPNNGLSFWKPTLDGDPAKYGALLAATEKATLAAEPGALVAYAGTVYIDHFSPGPAFVASSFEDNPGLAASLTTFAMHAYQAYPPQTGPESTTSYEVPLLDKIATMGGVLSGAGAPAVPLSITEIGWPVTAQDPADQQARYTVRAIVLGALGGADRLYVYTLRDGPNPSAFPPEDAFGLVNDDGLADGGTPTPKPAYVAVKALLGALGSYAVVARLPAQPDDVYAVSLADPSGHAAWIAWRALDGAPTVPVTVPAAGNVRVTHVDGTTSDDVAGPGGYTLQVGPDPVILTSR